MNVIERVASEIGLAEARVAAVLELMQEGATIPFIARYRKEISGGMDEVVITSLRDAWQKLEALQKRKAAILSSLDERELLTGQLKKKIEECVTMTELEDTYLPYRPKRKTRASKAAERGLEPLADLLLRQKAEDNPLQLAEQFLTDEVPDLSDALAGARDIIAERVSQHPEVRAEMRRLFVEKGVFVSRVIKGREKEASRYRDWFNWTEPVSSAPSHRILAMRRGEKELFLNLRITVDEKEADRIMQKYFKVRKNSSGEQVLQALEDGFSRLLGPQMETETRVFLKERADKEAVSVFAANLRELLLAPPLGGKRVLALDPGFRTGCKTVCLDEQGELLDYTTVFPHTGKKEAAAEVIKRLIKKYYPEYIAVGNGTAGRETETFLKDMETGIPVVMVNESGASIYSASKLAREEFPDLDLTVRGAISIGRRLQDPLAELVKIDPASVGVGQYQHDVDQKLLRTSLDGTVVSCVNAVGVNLNTASAKLLSYVSGLSPSKASSIIKHRIEAGKFTSREQLMKVSGIGPVAFQQCAGFLRIDGAENPLDGTAVHPESYSLVTRMAADLGTDVRELLRSPSLRKKINLRNYVTPEKGIPTLTDILRELEKPGRDPRGVFEDFSFADVHSIQDLSEGMRLPGIVTNVTDFGAFIDIGVHTDGLVHISRLSNKWVKNPLEVVHVGMKVSVIVVGVEEERNRISLSMV